MGHQGRCFIGWVRLELFSGCSRRDVAQMIIDPLQVIKSKLIRIQAAEYLFRK